MRVLKGSTGSYKAFMRDLKGSIGSDVKDCMVLFRVS